jgi:hypothetical protein
VHQSIVLIDDNTAVAAAKARRVGTRRSLGLVCDGLQQQSLSMHEARALIDELVAVGGARFPCDGAGFEAWAERHGLLR